MICSGLCRLRCPIESLLAQTGSLDSHKDWIKLRGAGHSFLRLVTHFITEANQKNSTPRIITCSASLWGRDETSSIVTILRESVSELAKHVDVTALARLPENYIAAMGYTSPPW